MMRHGAPDWRILLRVSAHLRAIALIYKDAGDDDEAGAWALEADETETRAIRLRDTVGERARRSARDAARHAAERARA